MRVGIYFAGYSPESGGGYTFEQEILLSLCKLTQQCRHELVLFFENTQGEGLPAIVVEKGLKSILLEPPRNVPKFKLVGSKILRKLHMPALLEAPHPFRAAVKREKVELVWFITPSYIPIDIPYIATVLDIQHRLQPWFPEVSQGGQWELREAHYSAYLMRAAYVITPNQAGQDELSLFYQLPKERFRLLPHPVPRIDILPNPDEINQVLEKYRLRRGYLYYPAQFWAHKNHINLLLALKTLKEKYGLEKELVLVGSDQGNFEYVRSMVSALGLENQVHLLGFIPRGDLISLYCGAFALVYVSLFGPENLPPLEAFRCGCPVIVSNYSGALEQFGEAALRVDALNPAEIVSAIIRLEQDSSLREALVEKGSVRAKGYNGMDYVQDVFKICDEFESVRRNWGVNLW